MAQEEQKIKNYLIKRLLIGVVMSFGKFILSYKLDLTITESLLNQKFLERG